MPRNRHRSKTYRQKRKRTYSSMPKTALAIFVLTVLIIKSGLSDNIEAAYGAYSARFGEVFSAFEQALSPDKADEQAPRDPTMNSTPDPDEGESQTELFEVGQLVFESCKPLILPAIKPDEATAITIDGASGGYAGSGSVYIKNDTKYDVNISELLNAKSKVKLSGDSVQVLIMHTHGTEAYTPTEANNYIETDTSRTTNLNYNVVRVGQEITDILNKNGIRTVHSETLNDSPKYSGSYTRALEDISAYIKANPSIKLVIDVHRDAMVSANGTTYKTVADIDGQQASQLLLVCGTDEGGLKHDNWRDNLSFQLKLHDKLNSEYPGIMRPLNIRNARFNQHVTYGSMILEVGTSGNTLEEALISARIFAESLSEMLK